MVFFSFTFRSHPGIAFKPGFPYNDGMKRSFAITFILFACLRLPFIMGGCAPAGASSGSPLSPSPVLVESLPTPSAAPEKTASEADLPVFTPPMQEGDVRVLFINVGKADAALVMCRQQAFLIDTGTEESVPFLFGALNYMGVSSLEGVFLTHTHSDHTGGMTALSRSVPVKTLYGSLWSENKKDGTNKITTLSQRLLLPLTRLSAGDAIPLGDKNAFTVLGPETMNQDDDNDNSLVLMLSANGRDILFTGDMQFAEEATLLEAGASLKTDVLKVGNHGNPDATGDAFAKAVSPQLAIVSTDTMVDTDSANPRVIAALDGAKTYITQDFPLGVLLTIHPDGSMELSNPSRPCVSAVDLAISEVNPETQLATIVNSGDTVDLSGYVLFSTKGGEAFVFPQGASLSAGNSLTVGGEGGSGDYLFIGEESPWHKKKADTAELYDRFGKLISYYTSDPS
jgi:competence protein ComEC